MQEGNPVRLMTFNLLFSTAKNPAGTWEERRPLVLRMLRDHQPDIIGFQEVMEDPLAELRTELPEYGVVNSARTGQSKIPLWSLTLTPAMLAGGLALFRGAARSRARRLLGGALLAGAALPVVGTVGGLAVNRSALLRGAFCPVFYRKDRFRLVESGLVQLSERPNDPLTLMLGTWLPRYATRARLEALDGSGIVTVYNLHLDYMPLVTKGSLEKLRRELDTNWDGTAQVVMGDFNADLDEQECAYLTEPGSGPEHPPGFQSAWCEAEQIEGPEHTLHSGMGEESPKKKRADHIMVRPSVPVLRCSTLVEHSGSLYPSDHYPIVAEVLLELQPREAAPRSESVFRSARAVEAR